MNRSLKTGAALVGVMIALSVAGVASAQAERPDARLITVQGEAEIKVVPDEVVLSFLARSEDRQLAKAKEANDGVVRAVLETIKKNGVDERSVQTSRLDIQPRYEYQTGHRVFMGYTVSNTLAVTLKDLSKFDGLLSDVLESGVTEVSGINFTSSGQKKLEDDARLSAVRNSREKAEAMAAALGQKLGRPYAIMDQGIAMPVPMFAMGARMAAEQSGPTIAPGEITVRSSVSVSFELEELA